MARTKDDDEEEDYLMTLNRYTNTYVFTGPSLTTGTLVSAPMIRREGRFFVIKYL
jgi:hypothetical protein